MGSGVHRALDRLRFGPRRTLNVRSAGISGTDAARRVDGWVRSKQVEFTGDVLIITGRGLGSRDGIAVIRDAAYRTLRALRRAGVVRAVHEDTPGSFVATLAPLRDLLEAPLRRRGGALPPARERSPVDGIDAATSRRLHELAQRSLDSLGIRSPSPAIINAEMERQFSLLLKGAPSGGASESWLSQAINRGLEEYDEHD